MAERENEQASVCGRERGNTGAIMESLVVRENVEAAKVEKKVERALQFRAIQISHIPAHEFDIDTGASGAPPCCPKRPLDRVDAASLPAQSCGVNGGLASAAAEVEDARSLFEGPRALPPGRGCGLRSRRCGRRSSADADGWWRTRCAAADSNSGSPRADRAATNRRRVNFNLSWFQAVETLT